MCTWLPPPPPFSHFLIYLSICFLSLFNTLLLPPSFLFPDVFFPNSLLFLQSCFPISFLSTIFLPFSFSPYPVSVLYLPLFLFMNLILNPLMHALSIHLSICPSIRLSSLWQSILVSLTTSMYLFIHIPLTSRDRAWEK